MNPPTPTPTHEEPGPGSDPTICPICYESHRTRWNTTCGHTVCIECWRSISRTHQRTEVACPICRSLTDITELVTPFVSPTCHIHQHQTHKQFLHICLQAYRYYLEQRYTDHTRRRESPYDVTHINPDPSTARIAIQQGENYLMMFPWQSLFFLVECTQTTRNYAKMKVRRCIKEHMVLSTHMGRSFFYTFDRPPLPRGRSTMSMSLDDMDVLSYYTMIYGEHYISYCLHNELCMIFVIPPTI